MLLPLLEEFSPSLEKGFYALYFEVGVCFWFKNSSEASGCELRVCEEMGSESK